MSKDITSLREEIDQLDEQLWEIIARRADLARQIGQCKRQHGQQIVQPDRWQQVMQHCQSIAQAHGQSETVVSEVMEAIHKESVRVQS